MFRLWSLFSKPTRLADQNAFSSNIEKNLDDHYYQTQCDLYFRNQEYKYSGEKPNYSQLSSRWEYQPTGNGLTGYGGDRMHRSDEMIRQSPCEVTNRVYKIYDTQPFGRALVTFYYGDNVETKQNPIHIYEEFTFNSQGQITFIEAWAYDASMAESPSKPFPPDDSRFPRMSRIIPGLGNSEGLIDITSSAFNGSRQLRGFRASAEYFYASNIEGFVENIMHNKSGGNSLNVESMGFT